MSNFDLAKKIQVELNYKLSDTIILNQEASNFVSLCNSTKEKPIFRVRETGSQILFTKTVKEQFDYIIGKTEDGYVLLEKTNASTVVDMFNRTIFNEGESTSCSKCTLLSFDNLIGVLMVIMQ